MRLIDGVVEAQARGDLLVTRIPQHRLAPADQHGYVGRVHMKSIEQFLRVRVAIQVDVVERMSYGSSSFLSLKAPRWPSATDLGERRRGAPAPPPERTATRSLSFCRTVRYRIALMITAPYTRCPYRVS